MLEENGIATVIVAVRSFRELLEAMSVPRALFTRHPMGRPLGAPLDAEGHRACVREALDLLKGAERAGSYVERIEAYRPRLRGSPGDRV